MAVFLYFIVELLFSFFGPLLFKSGPIEASTLGSETMVRTEAHTKLFTLCAIIIVLVLVKMAYRDEDSVLDQIYQKQIFSYFYYENSKSD